MLRIKIISCSIILILLSTGFGCSKKIIPPNNPLPITNKPSSTTQKTNLPYQASSTELIDTLKSNVQPIAEGGVLVYKDIVYNKSSDGFKLLLDLYLPVSTTKKILPAVVFIHGGGWMMDNKTHCQARDYLPQKDYAVACIDYRLSNVAKFPAQVYDIKAAVRWLRANANNYNIDPNHIGAWGDSAGGHLASMLGVSGSTSDLEGSIGVSGYSSRVQAVVDWFGPTDFSQIIPLKDNFNEYYQAATQLLGSPLENNSELIKKASPLSYISSDDPPFLIMHGDADETVPYQQSELFYNALKLTGVDVTYKLYPNNGHAFQEEKEFKTVLDFFDKHLKKN